MDFWRYMMFSMTRDACRDCDKSKICDYRNVQEVLLGVAHACTFRDVVSVHLTWYITGSLA